MDKSPGVRRTILDWQWGVPCLLPWEARQPAELIKTRPSLKVSGGCPKGVHAGLLTQENLNFSSTRSLWFLSCSVPCPSMVQVECSAVLSRHGQEHEAALQSSFYLRAIFLHRWERQLVFSQPSGLKQGWEAYVMLPSATSMVEVLPWTEKSWLWLLPYQLSGRIEVPRQRQSKKMSGQHPHPALH